MRRQNEVPRGVDLEQFRLAVEASPTAMILVGADGVIRFVNAEAERVFGYRAEELIGKAIEILAPARIHGAHPSFCRSYFANPRRRPMGVGPDLVAARRDGSEFPAEIGLAPIETKDELMALATVIDITARREAEEALSRRALELEQLNERLARFAYVASHDLQEPLRKIVSFSEVLARALVSSDQSGVAYANDVLRNSALHARDLVEDLLAYSRATSDAQRLQDLDLRELVGLALDGLSEAIKEAAAEIGVDVPRLTIRADRTQIIRLLQNLLSNALKYHKPGEPPKIHVSARTEGAAIRLAVADQGIGIEPKYHQAIFEPFKRLHPKSRYPGSGIGLAICKSIADRHGWSLTVESQLGQGATFSVNIDNSFQHNSMG